MISQINSHRIFLTMHMLIYFICLCFCPNVTASIPNPDYETYLKSEGYKTETMEQIAEAIENKSYFVRFVTLYLITDRFGEKAIPILRESLNDPKIEVRWRAAHLLGTLNDKSGLEQMQNDYKKYAPREVGDVTIDSNNASSQNRIQERNNPITINTLYALNAALVMAELGDLQGYDLAEEMAFKGQITAIRMEAVRVLTKIAKIEKEKLIEKKKDPEATLISLVESEKDPDYFIFLTSAVNNIGGEMSVRILEKAVNSTFIKDENTLNITKSYLKEAKEKMNLSNK